MSSRQELLQLREEINQQLALMNDDLVSFSVDANIVNRLGRELIGRAETGVSELIKNAYDADATKVTVDFINANVIGGFLIIDDDGHGMTKEDLVRGFMTLSTGTKIYEPTSPKYKRQRAGQKGIGRFATQFLGEQLTIITQVAEADYAIKLTIDWNKYTLGKDISSIENSIEKVEKIKEYGTQLKIDGLRHSWTDAQIRRVFRYVSDLLQPTFLSKASADLGLAQQNDESFLVECYRTENGISYVIADINKLLYEKCLAEIEGTVDENKNGYVTITSKSFGLNDAELNVSAAKTTNEVQKPFETLKNVSFIAYYFIYDRPEYYKDRITKLELRRIEDLAGEQSGLRVYRNGFRVLPYGEIGDDWLGLDRRRQRIDIETDERTVNFNIPYTNKNFFGFVEIIDKEGVLFEETASREGLIETQALEELRDFIRKAIIIAIRRLSPFVYAEKQKRDRSRSTLTSITDKVEGLKDKLDDIEDNEDQNNSEKRDQLKGLITGIESDLQLLLDELALLRILATLGITIGEFTHEIIQFPIFFNSKLKTMLLTENDPVRRLSIKQIIEKVNHLDTYTSYFNDAVSRNAKRDLEIIELRQVIRPFIESTKWDFQHEGIEVAEIIDGYGLFTVPMHPSEWHSILLNLYTNSKRALRRKSPDAKRIQIKAGRQDEIVFIEFSDNGDGVPEKNANRIFDAFFTTSTPASSGSKSSDQMIGSGLGLKILKDIILEYKGDIKLVNPPEGFATCFRIEIPAASEEQVLNSGL